MKETRYLATAAAHDNWIRTVAQARFARIAAIVDGKVSVNNPKKREQAVLVRRRLLQELRQAVRQMDALNAALRMNPLAAVSRDVLVRMSIVLSLWDASPYITVAFAAALVILGLDLVYRVAIQLVIDIPESEHGRTIEALPLG